MTPSSSSAAISHITARGVAVIEQQSHDQRRDSGTGIEARIDEAEDPAPGVRRCGLAHQHVARRKG